MEEKQVEVKEKKKIIDRIPGKIKTGLKWASAIGAGVFLNQVWSWFSKGSDNSNADADSDT